ncbi:carboxypeptidase M32 [Opitutus terrae]|uniref:Metal-dependent carboxypeptidase n=1 Tax=Opitutus terrae (strain DSM 11246 / JCM 15787 / PB90-1) TaxID=452637 RepID=B1ZXZ4_OPITP|nr:carboxypeptidase M32 [Opitutus terrae]ACB75193.1 Carboxypeptidase Taq [Opitutus terrae PB90-1]
MTRDDAYAGLIGRLKRVYLLGSVSELLAWDEQVNLPPDSADQRAEQHAVLAETTHAAASDPRIGELLELLDSDGGPARRDGGLYPDRQAVLHQARRDYDRATKLPAEFVREKAAQGSRGYHVWAHAKRESDFASYAPVLEKNLELAQREAAYLGWGDRPYDAMIDKNDPGLSAEFIAPLFAELKRELAPLAAEIAHSPVKPQRGLLHGFPVEAQRQLLREVTERIGFDYGRGRIDVSLHPFCLGTGADVRMTTRFKEDEPLDSLFSAIHETGHGLYEQGLPREHYGTALGMHAGMAVHESQSRLWENQVGRSRGFWRFFEPRLRELFPEQTRGVSADALYLAINAVKPTPIRIEADEVTYNLHIILRFELERKLFAGELAVRDLPDAWREAARELLGLVPANDREGVLQDVHWSDGSFGYFPSYCLGNMMAAQLWAHVRRLRPGLEEEFARGEFGWLLDWLRREVHAQGRRYAMPELVRRITGEEFSPRFLVDYLRERYGALYLR